MYKCELAHARGRHNELCSRYFLAQQSLRFTTAAAAAATAMTMDY
jgi:hypothetical protein